MSVSSETNKVTYSGDGSTATFSTSFSFSSNDEITVTLVTNSTGAEAAWTLGTQYTLTGAGTGSAGTLTVDTSPSDYTPASGKTLVIELKPAFTQTTSLPRGGTVSPKDTLEPMHDKRVRQLLYLKGLAERAVKVPVGETSGGNLPVSALGTSARPVHRARQQPALPSAILRIGRWRCPCQSATASAQCLQSYRPGCARRHLHR